MFVNYYKEHQSKNNLTSQVFKLFTDQCGGNAEDFANELYAKFQVEDFSYYDDYIYWNAHGYMKDVIVPHKVAVYNSGLEIIKTGIVKDLFINEDEFKNKLWIHDMSKFSSNEAIGYAFYNRENGSGKKGFEIAWNHHKNHNSHHPEFHLSVNRSGKIDVLEMPKMDIFEMVADWMGAGLTYGSSLKEWLPINLPKFVLHEESRYILSKVLNRLGIHVREEDNKLHVL